MFVRVLCLAVVLLLAIADAPARAGALGHFWKTNETVDRFDMVILPCEALTDILSDKNDPSSAAVFELAVTIYLAGFTMGHAHGRKVVGKAFIDSEATHERMEDVVRYCEKHPKAAVVDAIRWSVDQDPITEGW